MLICTLAAWPPACGGGGGGGGGSGASSTLDVVPSVSSFDEQQLATIDLVVDIKGKPSSFEWSQFAGPAVPLEVLGPREARAHVGAVDIAADTQLGFRVVAKVGKKTKVGETTVLAKAVNALDAFGESVQIGGATLAAGCYEVAPAGADGPSETWLLRAVGGRLDSLPLADPTGPRGSAWLPGQILDVAVVQSEGQAFALLAMGTDGLAVVDLADPLAPQVVARVPVGYEQGGLTWTDGGGNIRTDQSIAGTHGNVTGLETDGSTVWIANADYGLHRAPVANLVGPLGPVLEQDGTLAVDAEACTLQFASESGWGAPKAIRYFDGKLWVAQFELGLVVRDPATLERLGAYNPYLDTGFTEDWYADMDPAAVVQPGFLDAETGMPDYRQVAWEIEEVGHAGGDADTPWADFEGYGRWYYGCVGVDVAHDEGRTIAYLACGLGGVIAVDMTVRPPVGGEEPDGLHFASQRVGFLPPVPAKGPAKEVGPAMEQGGSLVDHMGIGRIKESGTRSVIALGDRLLLGDHFGGLIVVEWTDGPGHGWQGPNAPYDNDSDGIPGNHVPAFEQVVSYDMLAASPEEHESMPAFLSQPPCLVVSGEVGGHGGTLQLLPGADVDTAGGVDLLQWVGAGGLLLAALAGLPQPVDVPSLVIVADLPTTDELGAAPDGSATQPISIGHAEGVAFAGHHLYLSDGPHGVSAWSITDPQGKPSDEVRLVGNTVQSEGPVEVDGVMVAPATHAYGLTYDKSSQRVLVACKSLGLRAFGTQGIEGGGAGPGEPMLLAVSEHDCYEHKLGEDPGGGEDIDQPAGLAKQDQASESALVGDLAFVADGINGLTVYDLTCDGSDPDSGFLVGNIGGATGSKPPLGTSIGVALWDDPASGRGFAFVAAGPAGIGVVDISDPTAPVLVKVFPPIKVEEEGHVGKADGRGVDVIVHDGHVFLSYDSFGVVCYDTADLIAPLPVGVDPTALWSHQGGGGEDYRPVAVSRFRLVDVPGYEEAVGGALKLAANAVGDKLTLFVPWGDAGVVELDWTNPDQPTFVRLLPTAGSATDVAIGSDGRLYVADGTGGLVVFR